MKFGWSLTIAAAVLALSGLARAEVFRREFIHPILIPPTGRLSIEEGPTAFGKPTQTVIRIQQASPRFQGPLGKGLDLTPKVRPTFGPGVVFLGRKGFISGVGTAWMLKGSKKAIRVTE